MYKDDLYSYSLIVKGSDEDREKIFDLLDEENDILGHYLDLVTDNKEPYSTYFVPDNLGSVYEWPETSHEQLLHSIAVQVPNAILELTGQNEDDQSYGFQKRFHGVLYQEHKIHSVMPGFRDGLDVPFEARYGKLNDSVIEGALLVNEICRDIHFNDEVLMLAHLFRNPDLNTVPVKQLLDLVARVQEFSMRNDDPRFTREDFLDALTDNHYIDCLPSVLSLDDDTFDRLVTAAAEETRERLSYDNVGETMDFYEILKEAQTTKHPSLSERIADSRQAQANQMPGTHHPCDYTPDL